MRGEPGHWAQRAACQVFVDGLANSDILNVLLNCRSLIHASGSVILCIHRLYGVQV